MNRFEIIGVSYSGKSTLLNEMLIDKTNEYFYSADEILKIYKNRYPYNWFFRRIFREFLIRFFKYDDFSSYKTLKLDQIESAWIENYKYSLRLPFRSFSEKYGMTSALKHSKKTNTFIETLYFLESIIKELPEKPVILEEFFYHRNKLLFESIDILEVELPDWVNDLALNLSGLIYLHCKEDFLVRNIEKRRSENLINKQHRGLSTQQIVEELAVSKQKFEKLLILCESAGIPILSVDSSDSIEDQISQVKNFVTYKS